MSAPPPSYSAATAYPSASAPNVPPSAPYPPYPPASSPDAPPPAYPGQPQYQQQAAYEVPEENPNVPLNRAAFSNVTDNSIRNGFIRKVYGLLMIQLLVTVGFICLFSLESRVKYWVQSNLWFYVLAYITFIITYIVLICCSGVRRRSPGNFISLTVFTLALSYLTGVISSFHDISSVLIAMSICCLVCLSVSIFAACTKIDFTKCTAFLWFFGLAFFFFGIACLLTWSFIGPNSVLQAVYGGIGAILFSLYLCYDTQMIIGGRRHELSEEEYITGALDLYLDVVQIFLMLLMLIGGIGDN